MPMIAHFQVIHIARAFTSSRVTPGWKRMPPFDGPRDVLWCTRWPTKTFTPPSSILIGTATVRLRFGVRRISWTAGSRFMRAAASSSCERAASQADVVTGSGSSSGVRGWGESTPLRAAGYDRRFRSRRSRPTAGRRHTVEPWSIAFAGRFEEHEVESEALRGNALGDPHT